MRLLEYLEGSTEGHRAMTPRHKSLLVLSAISPAGYFPFSQWIATARLGTDLFIQGQLLYGVALLSAVVLIPAIITALLLKRAPTGSAFVLALSLIFIPCCITGIILGRKVRIEGMRALAQRGQ